MPFPLWLIHILRKMSCYTAGVVRISCDLQRRVRERVQLEAASKISCPFSQRILQGLLHHSSSASVGERQPGKEADRQFEKVSRFSGNRLLICLLEEKKEEDTSMGVNSRMAE